MNVLENFSIPQLGASARYKILLLELKKKVAELFNFLCTKIVCLASSASLKHNETHHEHIKMPY